LSEVAQIPQGQALAYLVAPPVEAVAALDAALKASDVELRQFFAPPTETNFSGGLLTGTQSACQAACEAFAQTVRSIAAEPNDLGGM
jgi:ethanolamine utilization protein EutL